MHGPTNVKSFWFIYTISELDVPQFAKVLQGQPADAGRTTTTDWNINLD